MDMAGLSVKVVPIKRMIVDLSLDKPRLGAAEITGV
jgi:hypothetical protein